MVGRVQSPALEDEREGTGVTGDRHHGDAKTRERRNGRGADRWLTARSGHQDHQLRHAK